MDRRRGALGDQSPQGRDEDEGQLDVTTPAEYIAAVDDTRRSDVAALDALIREHAPTLEPVIMDGMLGYGPFHYRYASGREGDACKISIASNASYISSLYCFASDASGYKAPLEETLRGANAGRWVPSCPVGYCSVVTQELCVALPGLV